MPTISNTTDAPPPSAPLDRPASDTLLKALYHERLLNPAAFFRARELLFPPRHWSLWVQRLLLILGATLILSGVILFFVFNWAGMPPFAKFGLIEAAILSCAIGAWCCRLESLAGKACSMGAAILTGTFLIVFGQVYPTGAEAYTFFAAWMLLITPWVFVARAPILWLLWMTLGNFTVLAFWENHHTFWLLWDETGLSLSLAGLNAAFLAFVEFSGRRGWNGIRARFLRSVLIVAVFGALVLPVCDFVFGWRGTWPGVTFAVSVLALAATYYYFRYIEPDLFPLAVGMLFICFVISDLILRILVFSSLLGRSADPFTVLFSGMCIVGVFAVAVQLLRSLSRKMPAAASGEFSVKIRTPGAIAVPGKPAQMEIVTMGMLLDQLQAAGFVTVAERTAISTTLFKSAGEKPTPWYVLAMIGFGAWLASWCFFGFVLLLLELGTGGKSDGFLVMGIVWLGAAILMSRTWEAIFFTQLALAMSAAGHALILWGIAEKNGSDPIVLMAVVASALCAALNLIYRTATHRFLSASLALIFIFLAAIDNERKLSPALCLVLALQALAVVLIFTHPRSPSNLRPIGFAVALALPIEIHALMFDKSYLWWWSPDMRAWPLNLLMVVTTAALAWTLTRKIDDARKMLPPLLVGIAVLGLFGGAGLLLGMALMALGYARGEREILAIGIATLSSFLFFYYFNLDTHLLLKSALVGSTGAILLLLRWLFVRRQPHLKTEAA